MHIPDQTPRLQADGLVLRTFTPSDIEGRRACGKDPEIIKMFGGTPSFTEPVAMSRDEATAWYDRITADPEPLHWAIEHDGRFIGSARLHSTNTTDRRARYAVGLLDRNLLGRGLGRRVTRIVLAYGFETVGLHRIDLHVLAFNTRGIRSYQSCGFLEEGREREAAYVDGSWHDDIIMGILDHEFAASTRPR